MAHEDLEYRLNELAARLARVEGRLGILLPEEAPVRSAAPLSPELDASASTIVPPPLPVTELEVRPAAERTAESPSAATPPTEPTRPAEPAPRERPSRLSLRPEAPARPASAPRRAPRKGPALVTEWQIGGRWFMVAGAIVAVIGVVLLLKQAHDAGWLRLLTSGMKCLAAAGFGAVLLTAGDVARRKINAAASAGLSAAGIAAMYASAYAAYGPYDLIGPALGFVLLAAVSALGIAVAVLAGLLSVAVLSVVGAYITPLLMGDASSAPLVLPVYLLAVLGVGLWLSAWRRVPFRALRGLVWWGTAVLGGLWTLGGGAAANPVLGLAFLGLVWGAVHAELTFSARCGAIGGLPAPASGLVIFKIVRPLLTSFGTSAWTAGLGVVLIRSSAAPLPPWFPPAGGTVAAAMLAGVLAGNLRVLRERPRDDTERLGAALMMQAGAMLIAAVSLGLADWMEVVAWLAMGVASMAAGRWIAAKALHGYGLVVLVIGAARLIVYDSWAWGFGGWSGVFLWLHLSRWTGLMALAALAWLAAGALIRAPRAQELFEDLGEEAAAETRRRERRWRPFGHACIGVGLTLLGAAFVHSGALATPIAVVAAWLGVVGMFAGLRLRSDGLLAYGTVLLGLATAWLCMADWRFLDDGGAAVRLAGLVLTRWTLGMALTGAAWLAAWRIVRRRALASGDEWKAGPPVPLAVGVTVVFASLLNPGGDTAAESVVGLALGLAMVALARRLRSPLLAVFSLVILGLVTAWLVLFEWGTDATAATARGAGGLVLTRWTALMAVVGSAWSLAARVVDSRFERAGAGVRAGLTALGAAMLFGAVLHGQAQASWVCSAWLGLSVLLLVANRLEPTSNLDRIGLGALGLTLAAWVAAFPMHGWLLWTSRPGLHPGLWMALAIVGAACVAWRFRGLLRAAFAPPAVTGAAIAVAVIATLFAATSLEVARSAGILASDERARKAAVSIWWGLFAIAMVAGGFWKGWPAARYVGLGLMALATAKALVYDLADITPAWRVASLLGLGLLMMGIAVGYSRVAQRFERARRGHEGEGRDQ